MTAMPPAKHAQAQPADADIAELRDQCTRFVSGHGPVRAGEMLATIPPGTAVDRYGDGGVVGALETEIATLLGKPAAVFLPSGTMAQQAVLRVHADRRGRRVIVFHPMCHLEQREGQGYRRLHQLTGRAVGDRNRLITVADLTSIAEPVAALLLELPQRDVGGQQPSWDVLAEQCGWASGVGAAASGRRQALGVGGGLWPLAGRGRRALRHCLCLLLQGRRGTPRLLRGWPYGDHQRGPRVAGADGRHALRDVAERRIGRQLPGHQAAEDGRLSGAGEGDRDGARGDPRCAGGS